MFDSDLSQRDFGRRNRKVSFGCDHVETDGKGNILSRPFVHNLRCFGNIVEYHLGLNDRPFKHVGRDGSITEHASRCAGCRVRPVCGAVADERIDSVPGLRHLHETWMNETRLLTKKATFEDATWLAFAAQCKGCAWTDSNDLAIAEHRKQRAAKERRRRAEARTRKRRRRSIEPGLRAAVETERNRRLKALLLLREQTNAPAFIAKLKPERCVLIANVWEAEELLIMARVEATTAEIARMIAGEQPTKEYQARVGEARKRRDRLVSEGYWEEFMPGKLVLNTPEAAVTRVLTP